MKRWQVLARASPKVWLAIVCFYRMYGLFNNNIVLTIDHVRAVLGNTDLETRVLVKQYYEHLGAVLSYYAALSSWKGIVAREVLSLIRFVEYVQRDGLLTQEQREHEWHLIPSPTKSKSGV